MYEEKFFQEEMKRMRERTGNVADSSKLVSFFYELLRDHLPVGEVERLVLNVTNPKASSCVYTNGYLAKYAQDIVQRLI